MKVNECWDCLRGLRLDLNGYEGEGEGGRGKGGRYEVEE